MADDSRSTDPLQDGEQTLNGETLSPGDVHVQRSRSDTDIVDKSTLEASSVTKVDGEDSNVKEKSENDLTPQDKALMSEFKSLMKKWKVGSDLSQVSMGASFSTDSSALMFMRDLFIPSIELMIEIRRISDPLERMVQMVKYYLSTIKLTQFGRKPLNPILGETVKCKSTHSDGSVTQLIGEQISHHPPTSACHIRNETHGIEMDIYAAPRASFWGKHVKIETSRGHRIYRLKGQQGQPDEEYFVEWPELYARIFRFNAEYCGKPVIRCPQTGYSSYFKFKDKPVFMGKWHVVEGYIVHEKEPKKNLYELAGIWAGQTTFINCATKAQTVFDRKDIPIINPELPSLEQAEDTQSEKVWGAVIAAMRKGDMKVADKAKTEVEERQRAKAKKDKETGRQHVPVYFQKSAQYPDAWVVKPNITL